MTGDTIDPFADRDLRARAERTLAAILHVLLLILPVLGVAAALGGTARGGAWLVAGAFAVVAALRLAHQRGHYAFCAHALVFGFIVFSVAGMVLFGSVRGPGSASLVGSVVLGGIFLGRAALAAAASLAIAALGFVVYAEAAGWLPEPPPQVGAAHWIVYAGIVLAVVLVLAHMRGMLLGAIEGQSRTEDEKRRAQERFQQVFDHSPDAITISRLSDGTLLAVNDAWLRQHGTTRERTIGRSTVELGVWRAEDRQPVRDRLTSDRRYAGYLRSSRIADGAPRELLMSMVVVDMQGEPCIISMGRDFTEQRRTEEELRKNRRLLETVIDAIPMSIFAKDLDSNYVMVNRYMAEFFGTSKEALLHHHTSELPTRDATRQQSLRDDQWVFSNRRAHVHETKIETPDGIPVPFHSSKIPLLDDAGELIGLLGINRDITEEMRAQAVLRDSEAQLRELNLSLERRVRERTAELEAANRELDSFGYSVSHDLRSPLGAINGYAYLLRTKEAERLSADGVHLLQQLETNATRMTSLVEGLLEFSRLGRRPVVKLPVPMAALVDEVIEEVRAEYRDRRIEFEVGAVPETLGDPVLLRQVWKNLIHNAAKYSRQRDPARIEIGYQGPAQGYFVRDNGTGFEMQYATRLFGVFERLHTESEFEGTGVGLAIVQRIVQRHGGTVSAEGASGRGATFRFTLPGG